MFLRAESEIYQCGHVLDKNKSSCFLFLPAHLIKRPLMCECAGGHATCLGTSEMLAWRARSPNTAKSSTCRDDPKSHSCLYFKELYSD